MRWHSEKASILNAARQLLNQGLVASSSGNVSMHLGKEAGENIIVITPTSIPYDVMEAKDIVVVDYDGDVIEGDGIPSSETLIHIAVYKARPDIKCVIHTHSIYASALAVTGVELPPILDELVTYLGGSIKVAGYGFPSTEELGELACQAMTGRNAVFLRNHGLLSGGRNIAEAMKICELVERASQIFIHALQIGKVNLLPQEIIEVEQNIYKMRQGQEG